MLYYISSSLKSCQRNFLKSFKSHLSIKMFEIFFKTNIWDIWINVLMKLVETFHATQSTITCLKTTMEVPERWVQAVQSLDPYLEPCGRTLSFSPLC